MLKILVHGTKTKDGGRNFLLKWNLCLVSNLLHLEEREEENEKLAHKKRMHLRFFFYPISCINWFFELGGVLSLHFVSCFYLVIQVDFPTLPR